MKKVISLFMICFLPIACGYHLRGTGSTLPPHIKKISIPMFKNMTDRFELEVKLTQEVRDEFVGRAKVELTGDEGSADAVLIGEITDFVAIPIAFSGETTADRYNISVRTRITLRDIVNRKVLFSNPHYIYQQEYAVPEGTDFESLQTEAIEIVAEKFARELITTILEGF